MSSSAFPIRGRRPGGLTRHLLSLAAIVTLFSLGACGGEGAPADDVPGDTDNDTPFGPGGDLGTWRADDGLL